MDATGQLVTRDVYDTEMSTKAKLLTWLGVPLMFAPAIQTRTPSASTNEGADTAMRCVIAKEEKHRIRLYDWLSENKDDPAFKVSYNLQLNI